MRRCFSILLLLACAPLGTPAQDNAQSHADQALALIQNGDLKRAEQELRKAVALAPRDAALVGTLGSVLAKQGDLHQANAYFAKAVAMDETNALLRRNLAANQWQLGRLKEARRNLTLLIRQDANDRLAIFLLGMVAQAEGAYSESISLLESVPDVVRRRPEAMLALAASYYHTGQASKAREALAGLPAGQADAKLMLDAGRVAAANGDDSLAEKFFSGSESADLLLAKGSLEFQRQYYSDAALSYSRALELKPSSLEAKRGLAAALWCAGDLAKAGEQWEAIVREFPNDSLTLTVYAALLLESGSPEKVKRGMGLLRQAIAANPSLAEARFQLGLGELAQGDTALALSCLKAALRLNPQDSRIHYAMSRAYRRLGDADSAARELAIYHGIKAAKASEGSQQTALGMSRY